ncbi:cAMP-dependent protein kinase catalytic subunit beta-like [Macrosteles quadrilineatus]|uniref:cAMP-dependent protein kinase catalytic subunit beta-like n=1 Tax=Macrosteles quadrilineatus TaxID=74068 RepID=UPI0023E26688|nr:cAMP-dependent protein kinase catalytic subunit beta-like [Macrosteles quadrilineatus]
METAIFSSFSADSPNNSSIDFSADRRLAMFGPLDIKNDKEFLKKAVTYYKKRSSTPFPYRLNLNNFEPLYFLGQGAFGKVILVKYKVFTKSYYAMKIVNKKALVEKNIIEFALNEKRILQGLNHPFCIRLEYFTSDPSNLYYLLPYIAGGDLFGLLQKQKRFDEHLSRFYIAQIVLALEYLHCCHTIHRDLKPENMILDHFGYIRIADFGFAKELKGKLRAYTFCGTPDYIAPEVILGNPYSNAVDWWALGVMAFEMARGRSPFTDEDHLKTYKRIVAVDYSMPSDFTPELADLVSRFLQSDVTKRLGNLRLGIAEIKEHKWFEKIDWLKLFNRRVVPPYIPPVQVNLEKGTFPHLKKITKPFSIVEVPSNFDKLFEDF